MTKNQQQAATLRVNLSALPEAVFYFPKHLLMSNKLLQNTRLSLGARGLLGFMLCVSPLGAYTFADLKAGSADTLSEIHSYADELLEAGYVTAAAS